MALVLVHLGSFAPQYLLDCVSQARLWSPEFPIYTVLDYTHRGSSFSETLAAKTTVVFTDELERSPQHLRFLENYKGDEAFRGKYWRHVKERFFYIQELMTQKNLSNVLYAEYDVLWYYPLEEIVEKLKGSRTVRCVKAEPGRAHPATIFFPTFGHAAHLAQYVQEYPGWDDMNCIGHYCTQYNTGFLPCCPDTYRPEIPFLSWDFRRLGILFDSLVYGQYVTGVDVRNTGGVRKLYHDNETSYYHFADFGFVWMRDEKGRWYPTVDGHRLVTIHVHSKALSCFMSNRRSPVGDYDPLELLATLEKN